MQRTLDLTRDELAAWAVYFQQQKPDLFGTPENQANKEEPYQVPPTVLTAMASQGGIEIEVTDPDRYPVGKYIVIQESLIYLAQGKGSLIFDRPLCRDFLAGTIVRPLTEEDQYRLEEGEIYLRNPQPSHSNNGEHGNSTTSQGQNGNVEVTGLDGNSHLGNGEAVDTDPSNDLLPCGSRGQVPQQRN